MEGKALLFKNFAGVDGFPICIDAGGPTTPIEERVDAIVETVRRIAPVFGGINLEDIAAPACFAVEERLRELLDIPVFHDDQHGTAVVTLAALNNSLKIVGKAMADLRVVIAGAGAAGVAIAKMLLAAGASNIVACDTKGAIHKGRTDLNSVKQRFADITNPEQISGSLRDVLPGADVFIGVSAPDLLDADDIRKMAHDPIVFAMSNPNPEIRPELCKDLVAVMATGRSDYPNQINNVLAFPGIFRGALDAGATDVTEHMKQAAAEAIAAAVAPEDLRPGFVIPSVFDTHVSHLVATAVAEAAVTDGVCRPQR
jgi:malate dehydrogenase (oxaloacetate-decarboxylating)